MSEPTRRGRSCQPDAGTRALRLEWRSHRARRAAFTAGGLLLAVTLPVAGLAEPIPLPRLGPAPNFALTTQQNDRLWLTQLRERIVVLTFACTTCGACPGVLPALLELTRSLGGAAGPRVFFVAVSVDPQRDTVPVLRRFARERGVDLGAWALLTGKPAEVDVAVQRYGVEVRRDGDLVRHSCGVALIDRTGTLRARYRADQLRSLPPAIEALLREARP